jgi:hypothetical protein
VNDGPVGIILFSVSLNRKTDYVQVTLEISAGPSEKK